MARKPRIHYPGALYHVIIRGNARQDIFFDKKDRYRFYLFVQEGVERFGHRVLAFCLMTNHVHIAIQVGDVPLSRIMQNLTFRYTRWVNWRLNRSGHLFQGRYKAIICDRDKYLLALVRYIHLNPVRAKLTTRPERYAYSGHNSYLTNGTAKIVEVTPILKLLGGKKAYERFVLEAIGENHNEAYYAVEDQRFLGEEGFGEEISRDTEQNEERKAKKPIETSFKEIARRVDTPPELLRGKDRRWDISAKRAEAVALLVRDYGYAVGEVAKYLGRDQANISTMLSRLSARQTERSR